LSGPGPWFVGEPRDRGLNSLPKRSDDHEASDGNQSPAASRAAPLRQVPNLAAAIDHWLDTQAPLLFLAWVSVVDVVAGGRRRPGTDHSFHLSRPPDRRRHTCQRQLRFTVHALGHGEWRHAATTAGAPHG